MNLDLASMTVAQLKERARDLGVDDDERVTPSNGHRPIKDDWVEVVEEALEETQPSQSDRGIPKSCGSPHERWVS